MAAKRKKPAARKAKAKTKARAKSKAGSRPRTKAKAKRRAKVKRPSLASTQRAPRGLPKDEAWRELLETAIEHPTSGKR